MAHALQVLTAHDHAAAVVADLAPYVDDLSVLLPATEAIPDGEWVRFSVVLVDGTSVLEGVGRCQGLDPATGRVRLSLLQFDERNEIMFERVLLAGQPSEDVTGLVSLEPVDGAAAPQPSTAAGDGSSAPLAPHLSLAAHAADRESVRPPAVAEPELSEAAAIDAAIAAAAREEAKREEAGRAAAAKRKAARASAAKAAAAKRERGAARPAAHRAPRPAASSPNPRAAARRKRPVPTTVAAQPRQSEREKDDIALSDTQHAGRLAQGSANGGASARPPGGGRAARPKESPAHDGAVPELETVISVADEPRRRPYSLVIPRHIEDRVRMLANYVPDVVLHTSAQRGREEAVLRAALRIGLNTLASLTDTEDDYEA